MSLQLVTLLAQLIAAAIMTGVIWQVQLVTYPQFLDIGSEAFAKYHQNYTARISFVVIPPMLLELGAALLGASLFWQTDLRWLAIIAVGLVFGTWITTFTVQVPLHAKLSLGFSESTARELVRTNWIRTALWTLHLAVVLLAVWRFHKP